MTKLPIQTGENNPILLAKSKAVSSVERDIVRFIKDMRETLVSEGGLGLAAPQVGKNIRIIVVALQKGEEIGKDSSFISMINPEIIFFSDEKCSGEEGCLSLPGEFFPVERAKSITVKFLSEKGEECLLSLDGINARIVQHEVDHLEGILITERVREEASLAS